MTTRELKQTLRAGPFAWPGGYPIFFITSDGAALSFEAVRAEFKPIVHAMRQGLDDGWRVIAAEINWEDAQLTCDHTNQRIPSAYAD